VNGHWWRSEDQGCAECGTLTNHTTAQHHEVEQEQRMCQECGEHEKMDSDPDTRICASCYSDEQSTLASYYTPDEGGQD
jgi:protein-arginine kinase activator protein McsA